MSLSLSGYRISLIYTPTDMRCGFTRLSSLAKQCAQIDVSLCRDCVVFVSKARVIAKVIWADAKGSFLLTRRLDDGRFQKLLARLDEGENMKVSKELLLKYLDGEAIQSVRTDYHQGS